MIRKTQHIVGLVDHLSFESSSYSSGRLKTVDGGTISFSGPFHIGKGAYLVLSGFWESPNRLMVTGIRDEFMMDPDALILWMTHHPDIRGLGPIPAKKLAQTYGAFFEDALMHRPAAMAETARVPLRTIELMAEVWKQKTFQEAGHFLAKFGLHKKQIAALLGREGDAAYSRLRNNPYLLLQMQPGYCFKRLDGIAQDFGVSKHRL